MPPGIRRHESLFLALGLRVVLGLSSTLSAASDAAAPTASQDPGAIDQLWRQASAKYDSARAAILKNADSVIQAGPFRADWQSLRNYKAPDWYRDAKFGIFIHWGVYSVPAFGNEWYPRNMYREGSPEYKHHLATYGSQEKFGYKDFIPMFKAEHYDPAAFAGQSIQSVTLLGSGDKLAFRQQADGLHITLPAQAPGKYAYAYRIDVGAR